MKTIHTCMSMDLLLSGAAMLTVGPAQADTYSWTNFQSDVAGAAQHIDPDLLNPWGIWVAHVT